MRTLGHREGNISDWGLLGGNRRGMGVGNWGEIAWGEMPIIGGREMEAANHIAMYVPMQQSCMICTCTPKPKMQLKKFHRLK